jgi:hypothetical protein
VERKKQPRLSSARAGQLGGDQVGSQERDEAQRDVEGGSQNCASEFGGASGGGVGALNGNVEIPVRRHAVLKLFGTKRAGGRGVASVELEDGVNLIL